MVEQRKLTEEELDRLILEASESEKHGIVSCCEQIKMKPIEMFKRCAVEWDGLVTDGRPIYVAGVFSNGKHYELWTVVNSNVKEQISLFKCAKRGLKKWCQYIPEIYATMMKSWDKNRVWTERLGLVPCRETEDTITYVLKEK